MARKKDVTPNTGEKKRIVVILFLGLPILFAVYGYFYFYEEGRFEGTSLEDGPRVVADWCVDMWGVAVDKVMSLAQGPDDIEVEVTNEGEEVYAPGSAGNLANPPKMYGMEVPLEEHRKLVLESTKGGQLHVPEEEVVEEIEAQ
jgi:hypothetical protein